MVEQKIWLFASQGHIYEPRKSVNFFSFYISTQKSI